MKLSPNTCLPISANTVIFSLGYGSRWCASTDTPTNNEPRMIAIQVSVVAAFFGSGRLNAGTPFEIASTPVSATAPDEKPFNNKKIPSVPPVCCMLWRARLALYGTVSMPPNQPNNAFDRPSNTSAVTMTM